MAEYLSLTESGRSRGYVRSDVRQDVLYGYCKLGELSISVARKNATVTRIVDEMAEAMLSSGIITRDQYDDYLNKLQQDVYNIDRFDDYSIEKLYRYISDLRKAELGTAVDSYMVKCASKPISFVPSGIDQGAKKTELLKKKKAVIFAVTQPGLFSLMLSDAALAEDNEKWVLCDGALHGLLPENVGVLTSDDKGVFYDARLQEYINNGEACLFVYGDEGLFACRGLLIDAVVHAETIGYHAQATTGIWTNEGCIVYIPSGMDMTKNVPLTKKTRLNYGIMYRLWKDFGDTVYTLTLEQLYSRYPKYFINVYNGKTSKLPLDIKADGLSEFDRQLEKQLIEYLSGFESAEYMSAYFDKELNMKPVCYDSSVNQDGILVQAVKINQAENARVISCEKGKTPRQTFEELNISGAGIVSNFLFFMTPKLGILYNDLRSDRPNEQADAASGHLDYMKNETTETFPLFAKSCIAMKNDGRFLFFNHRLGGGCADISGVTYRWEKEDVNSDSSCIRVYAPSYAASDRDADRNAYKKAVGHDRVNVVILRDRVTCIRRGDVLLPSVGIVLSLTEDRAQPLLEKCAALKDGYYDVSKLTLNVKLDKPENIADEDWENVKWSYGGGLTLIRNGVGLCDGDNMEKWFDDEGWTNPLSRQTQESNLHSLVKHPRTAIGCTDDGSLVILVYSGRTWRSTGADYSEMIEIARRLYPDVNYLMNCDGGGSAMLGMVHNGEFMELSFPSTSSGSVAGQVRPINTVFYVPVE